MLNIYGDVCMKCLTKIPMSMSGRRPSAQTVIHLLRGGLCLSERIDLGELQV